MRWLTVRLDAAGYLGLILVLGVVAVVALGPLVSGQDPILTNPLNAFSPPSSQHWFGTDDLGRDVFTRVAVGGRYSLTSGVVVVILSFTVGALLGGAAGYFGGLIDEVLMRVTELVMAFPALILVMVVAFSLGPSFWSAVVALAIAWTPSFVRLTRSTVLQIRAQTFVEATRALGASSRHLVLRTILPHAVPALLPKATTNIGMVVIVSAGLSYVGLGVRPPTPDWGNMIADSTQYVFQGWWLGFFPGLAIFLTVVGLSLLGDSFQESSDPALRRRAKSMQKAMLEAPRLEHPNAPVSARD